MSKKQIPTLDFNMSSKYDEWIEGYVFEDLERIQKKFREVIKYTLEQAAENAKTITLAPAFGNLKSTVKVNKESILSLEQQIIKDLGL